MKIKKGLLSALVFSLLFCVSGSENKCSHAAIPASNTSEKTLVVGGKCVGVTLSTNGVLVTDISDVANEKGKHLSPARDAGLKPGDLIQSFNNKKTMTVPELNSAIKASDGKAVSLEFIRDGCLHEVLITPCVSQTDQSLKIGAWVKDAASGIGTITYYDPQTNEFAALGHGICDTDTGEALSISTGNIYASSIISVNKGEKGIPGELSGVFEEDGPTLGEISKNLPSGIFGKANKNFLSSENTMPVASRKEITTGKAQILSNIEGQKTESFDIEILRIVPNKISVNKGMIIKITDKNLLDKTGGIVRGMSGSPIIQNGKIVGAVTHVFVNDPTRGYGIFIENMLDEAMKVN